MNQWLMKVLEGLAVLLLLGVLTSTYTLYSDVQANNAHRLDVSETVDKMNNDLIELKVDIKWIKDKLSENKG